MAGSSKTAKLYQVDAFTHEPFGGNSAAVVLLGAGHLPLEDNVRQGIAMEMNLSETSFLEIADSSDEGATFRSASRFVLRWFTPATEVPLCGHATLAAAAALWTGEGNPAETLYFDTVHSGQLTVSRGGMPERPMLHMDLPLRDPVDPVPSGITPSSDITKALNVHPSVVRDIAFNAALKYLVVCLWQGITRQQFEGVKPDFARLASATEDGAVFGVILTVPVDEDGQEHHEAWSRFFAPCAGINEDPVTGSAHAVLGPYWSKHLQSATDGKLDGKRAEGLRFRQCSARGGELLVKTDWQAKRVTVSGGAVVVLSGQLYLP